MSNESEVAHLIIMQLYVVVMTIGEEAMKHLSKNMDPFKNNNNLISFSGGDAGLWTVRSMTTIIGDSLDSVARINVSKNIQDLPGNDSWKLNAFISNLRYTTKAEKISLDLGSKPLGMEGRNFAALIPIKKSDAWWKLPQDERRKIFEDDSKHIALSLEYLPFISRQLHHCRDLGEPFDFLTWFEFSSEHEDKFNALVQALRQTTEWNYVTREIDIRLAQSKI